MAFPNDQPQSGAFAHGARLETILASEVTLVPFPPGEYRVAIGGMEHPAKTVINTAFPAVLVTVLPGCRESARLDTADQAFAWLEHAGEQTILTVAAPGAVVLFTTYRPSEYPTTGIRMDIERLKHAETGGQPAPQPQPQAAPRPQAPQQPAPRAPEFPRAPAGGFPQAPGGGAPAFAAPNPGGFPGGFPGAQGPAFPQAPAQSGSLAFEPRGFGAPAQPTGGFAAGPQPGWGGAPQAPRAAMPPFGAPAGPAAGFAPAAPRPFSPMPPSQPAAPTPPPASAPGIRMAAHIENEGDVAFEPGQPAGRPGSKRRLEAVALYAEDVTLHEMEYAAVSYNGQLLPWVCPPQFTGSRGMGAPLLGFAARLTGDTAARFDIGYSGNFMQAGQVGPVKNGEFLQSPIQGDPLEALIVLLQPKRT